MDLDECILPKDVLHDILRVCRLPKNHKLVVDILPQLPHYVRIVWSTLAADTSLETDIWTLYSRVAIIGMYYLNWHHASNDTSSDNEFLSVILRVIYQKEHRLIIRPTMNFNVRNRSTFIAAMIYGLMSLITFKPGIYRKEQLTEVYSTILDNCRCNSRHTSLYFVLMYNFVHLFVHSINAEESEDLLRLAYNNIERKDSVLIVKTIMKSSKIDAKKMFDTLVTKVTWDNKYKFVVLTELLSSNPHLISFVNHEDFAKIIIRSQGNAALASVAGKLYSTLVDEVPERVWVQKYFPVVLNFIQREQDISIYQKNTFKYILIKTFKHYYSHFSEVLISRNYNSGKMPIYSVLYLTRIIIENKFDISYDFPQIMDNSYFHADASVRSLFFYILTNQDFSDPRVFATIKEFIVLNINDADNGSRDYIKKTYDSLIKSLLRTIIDENEESLLRARTLDLFNWLIKFLFHQFKPYCNYQRLALSFQMIYITFFCFKEVEKERRLKILQELDFYKNSDNYLDLIKDMLIFSNKDDANNVIKLAVEIIPYSKFKQVAQYLQEDGFKNICSANIETSLCAERAIEFYMNALLINKKYDEHKNMLRNLAAKVSNQWILIQRSNKENIITEGIAFGAPLNLVSKNISLFHPINIFTMIHLAESIVYTLMEVFQIRAMIQYKGDSCFGIALAFSRENSPYHAVTVNTMWLALKSVCKLLLALVHHIHNEYVVNRAIKCLKSIIRNCYHKGILEEASTTLSSIVAFCTNARQNTSLLEDTLTDLLKEIPCVSASNSTVRRCAEIRLILCSLALSDKRPSKPLYHKAMSQLCDFLNTPVPSHTIEGRCLVLHCLQPLLTDTQVENHAGEYYERVVLSILNNFQDPSWNIRNAALQAFGAISHKLIGSPTTSDKTQRHAISLEELFYRFRNLYPMFIVQIKAAQSINKNTDLCKQLHSFTPVGCLLSMTYSRGEELYPIKNSCITYISSLLILLLKSRSLPEESILIARSFTAICQPRYLKKRIKLAMYDLVFKKSNFFGWVYLIRCLCDKLLAESDNLAEDPKDFILATTDQIIKSLIVYDEMKFTKELRYAIFILYRSGVTAIGRKFIEYHFEFFCEKSPTEEYPQFWIDDLLVDLFSHEKILDLKVILKDLLFYDFPLDLKTLCFDTLFKRISKRKQDNQIFADSYGVWLINFLNNSKCWTLRVVSEKCVKLLLYLKPIKCDAKNYENSVVEFVGNREILPYYFCTVLFGIYQNFIEWKSTDLSRELCLHCIENCYLTLDLDHPDVTVLESVIYISRYAKKFKYVNLLLVCVELTYQILQEDDPSLLEIGEKSLEVLFDTKGTFPFANILYLVDNVERLVGYYNALDFLGAKYWDRYSEVVPLNAFEQPPVLKVHSSVLKERLIKNFNAIYDKLDNEERVEYYGKVLRKTNLI